MLERFCLFSHICGEEGRGGSKRRGQSRGEGEAENTMKCLELSITPIVLTDRPIVYIFRGPKSSRDSLFYFFEE